MNNLLEDIRTEADLCRNETANDIADLLDRAADEIEKLQKILENYANPMNWDEDHKGIRRIWLEPESKTPDAYNGFELASKVNK